MHTKVLDLEPGESSSLSRYGIALLSVTLAAVLALVLRHWGHFGGYSLFYGAILVCVWLGHFFTALAATASSTLAIIVIYWPYFTLTGPPPYNAWRLGLFVLVSLGICLLARERERSDAAHRASEQYYRQLFDRNLAGVFLSTLDGQILSCNESFAQILGYDSCSEVLLHPASDFYFDRSDRDSYIEELKKVGSITTLETCLRGKDDRPVWIIVNVTLLEDDNGALTLLQGTIIDITERKNAEETLRASEQRYRQIVETAGEGIWLIDAESRTTFVNKRMAVMLGYSVAEMDGASLFEFMDEEGKAIAAANVERRRRGIRERHDFKFRRKDGSALWAIVSTDPIVDSAGQYAGALGLITDITERRQAEAALRQAEQKYRDIFENVGEGIFQTTPEGQFIAANPALARMHGFATSEELIDSWQDIARQVYVDPAQREEFKRLLDEHGLVRGFEHQIFRKDGSKIWISENARAVHDDRGVILYYEGTAQDINESRRAEDALRESEARFRQLSEAAFESIILHDQGTILEVNQSFCRMYGYERAEVIGKSVLDLALPQFHEQLLKIVRSGDTDPYESPALRKDGTVFRAVVAGKPINYQGHVVRVAAIRDISHQKRNERRQAAQYAVTRVLAESATLAEAIPKLLRVICESLRWKIGEFWRVSDNTNLLRCVEAWYVPGLDATSFIEASNQIELAPDAGLHGRAWLSGQPAWTPDILTDPGFARAAIAEKVGLSGALAFPILQGNNTLGVMQFFSRRPLEVDEDLLKMMSAVSSQIGQFAERKRAEDALHEAERKYRDIFEYAVEGIFRTSPDGRFIAANPALARMLGYDSPAELIPNGSELASQMYVEPQRREEFKRLMGERGLVRDFEFEVRRKDGTKIWISEHVRAVLDDNGELVYYEGTAEDITERKQAQEALRESEERYREIFDNAHDAIYVHDLKGEYISVNRAAEKLSGFTRNEIIGKNFAEFIAPKHLKEIRARMRDKLTGHQVTTYETEIIAKDGHRVHVELSSRLIYENGIAVGVQGIARDISDRKRTEEALRNFPRRLIGAQEAERRRVAHELHDEIGQALTAIRITLQSVQNSPGTSSRDDQMNESIGLVDQALQQVRDMALALRPSLLDDLGLVAALRWYLNHEAGRAGLVMELTIDELRTRLAPEIETTCFRIGQEALTNVIRHAHAKRVRVNLGLHEAELSLIISDDGIGFDVDAKSHRLARNGSLGLRGMQERALSVGGRLEIESSKESGTEIRVHLPFLSFSSLNEEN